MTNLRLAADSGKTVVEKKGKFFDYNLLIIVLFLIAFGLVMLYSTSSFSGLQDGQDSAFYFKKQLVSTGLGLFIMTIVIFVDYHVWYKLAGIIYIGSIISILLVLTPIGLKINGARRWISVFGIVSLQPAEIAKLGMIISLSAFVCFSGKAMLRFKNNMIALILTAIPAMLLYTITNNLSSAIIILGISYVVLIVSTKRPKVYYLFTFLFIALVIAGTIYIIKEIDLDANGSFRIQRLITWINPQDYADDEGYQTIQGLYAIGSGGLFGKGLGHSIQKLGYIPEAQNDMIFSIVCEELGLFGAISLILLFVLLIWRLVVIANNAPDLYGSLLTIGVMAHIAIQVILNIAVVTNTIPNTGITLPFISYGGTSIVFLMTEMGIALNVSRLIVVSIKDKNSV